MDSKYWCATGERTEECVTEARAPNSRNCRNSCRNCSKIVEIVHCENGRINRTQVVDPVKFVFTDKAA